MRVSVLGGGGFRVPLVYRALLAAGGPRVDELALYDTDASRLERVVPVLEGLARERGHHLPFRPTLDLDAALDGADVVLCAIRVGGLEGRAIDERVALDAGVVGQETVGPGGIAFALRTVPVMVRLATAVAERAPGAWFVNLTNPVGLVTEAIRAVLGDRAIGVCDTPTDLCRRVAAVLGRRPDELEFDYAGLNHLGWLRAVRADGVDLLPGLLADDARLGRLEETRLFGAGRLRELGAIPNEYLFFYERGPEVAAVLGSGARSRGESLLASQRAFYATERADPTAALAAWRAARREREAGYFAEARAVAGVAARAVDRAAEEDGGYAAEAVAVIGAVSGGHGRTLIVDVANASALPFLDANAVVEVPAVVGPAGAVPVPSRAGPLPAEARALVERMKEVERTTIRAALERSRSLAIGALARHPLVPSEAIAAGLFDAYAERHAELAGWPR